MSELVSVIVPMYNHAQFIEQCLDSVYNEDYPNIELIIIDDGSKDDSLEIAKKWRESHPGVFHKFHIETQLNQGICKTMNRLVALSQGEFICPLASDDFLLQGYVRTKLECLKSRSDWLAVLGDATLVSPQGKVLSTSVIKLTNSYLFALSSDELRGSELIFKWNIPLSIMFFRRKCFEEGGVGLYNESLIFEDRDFCLRLLANKVCGFINCNLYAYRSRFSELCSEITNITPGLNGDTILKSILEIEFSHHSSFTGIEKIYLYSSKYNSHRILDKIARKSIKKVVYSIYNIRLFVIRIQLRLSGAENV